MIKSKGKGRFDMKNCLELVQQALIYFVLVVTFVVHVTSQGCTEQTRYNKFYSDVTFQEEAAFTRDDVMTSTDCIVMCNRRLNDVCAGVTFNQKMHVCAGYDVSLSYLTNVTQLGNVAYEREETGPDLPADCSELWFQGERSSGVYVVKPRDGRQPINVFCEMTTNGSWLVIQKRADGSVNFTKTWNEYRDGFGNLSNEFWLGNKYINRLTSLKNYILKIDLTRFNGEARHAIYNDFSLDTEINSFTLHIGNVSGDAGDSLRVHDKNKFSTMDRDNDLYSDMNCADKFKGGWWFVACHDSNLNGEYFPQEEHPRYGDGVAWFGQNDWITAYKSLEQSVMKIQPAVQENK